MRIELAWKIAVAVFLLSCLWKSPALADPDDLNEVDLGEEYSDYARTSPRAGSSSPGESSLFVDVLLYLPNRLLDLLDIFRIDVGIGPATGAVLRLTDYGQLGARYLSPGSLRLGLFGRDWPVRYEEGDEYGIGPEFHRSRDRKVGKFELGLGADVLLAGGYLGLRFDEVFDFLGGVLGFDILEDDLQ